MLWISDTNITDAARWGKGFTKGRHIFEIGFPAHMRGKHCSVGIGTKLVPLRSVDNFALIGSTIDSWGIDLSTCQATHDDKVIGKYPKGFRRQIPDRFYMYIDLEENKLYFGADSKFYGAAFQDIESHGSALFPMVSATLPGATISLFYRGKGMLL